MPERDDPPELSKRFRESIGGRVSDVQEHSRKLDGSRCRWCLPNGRLRAAFLGGDFDARFATEPH